jgi:SAM-dependent methyltransferase
VTHGTAVESHGTMSQAMPHAHNYHEWVFRSFAAHLRPGTALEIGSGHGAYSRKLAAVQREVIVSDIDPAAIDRIRGELGGLPNVRYLVMDGLDPAALGAPVDNVVLLNLLEHVERDAELLGACRANLAPRGVLVVFSPAFPALYSRMDREAGHFRRYTRAGLAALVELAGFEVVAARHFNALGFFGWYANKLAGSGIHAAGTNAQITLFDRLVPLVRRLDPLLPFVGQSLVVVGRRDA